MGRGWSAVTFLGRDWRGRQRPKPSETDAWKKKKGGGGPSAKCLISCGLCFLRALQLCSAISSTHRDGAEGGTASVPTLPTAEQGSPPSPKLLYAKRIAVVCDQLKYVPWFCLPEILFFFFQLLFSFSLDDPLLLYTQVLVLFFLFFIFPIRWSYKILSFFFLLLFRWLWLISKNKLNCQ